MMALAPSSYDSSEERSFSLLPWGIAGIFALGCFLFQTFSPYTLNFFEIHHSVELARIGTSPLASWPVWSFGAVSAFGIAGYYSLLKELLPEHRVAGLSTFVLSSSVCGLILLLGPTMVGVQWAVIVIMAVAVFYWWQWRCAPRTNPPAPMQWQDCLMGAAFGSFIGFVGWLPSLWIVGLITLWFLRTSTKRFSVLEWWEDYRGLTLYAAVGWGISLLVLLVQQGLQWRILSPFWMLPVPLSLPEQLMILAVGLLSIGLPWGGYAGYALLNFLKHKYRRGRAGQLFDRGDDAMHRYAAWTLACSGIGLITAIVLGQETSLFLIVLLSIMAVYVGVLVPKYRRMLYPSSGLKRVSDAYPFVLLGVGVLSAWMVLTLLPDYYLPDVTWRFPGDSLIQESSELKGGLALFISIPVWKIWLLIVPALCVVGSAVLTSMQFVNFSLKRSMVTLGTLSVIYTMILVWIQWPITHPSYTERHARTLKVQRVNTLFVKGFAPSGIDVKQMPISGNISSGSYSLIQENDYYTLPIVDRRSVMAQLPMTYLSLSSSPLLFHSMMDVFPFYTHFVSRNQLLIKASTGEHSSSVE